MANALHGPTTPSRRGRKPGRCSASSCNQDHPCEARVRRVISTVTSSWVKHLPSGFLTGQLHPGTHVCRSGEPGMSGSPHLGVIEAAFLG